MLVSIVTPVYNTEAFLKRTIEGVIAQTYKDWELLLVIDAKSTDQSLNIAQKMSKEDSRIFIFKGPSSGGVARNRNLALENARGEYIAFLDADDFWKPTKLERQVAHIQNQKTPFSFHLFERIDGFGKKLHSAVPARNIVGAKDLLDDNDIGCSTVMIHRSLLQGKKFYDGPIEDFVFWWEILSANPQISAYLLPEVLGKYRVLPGSRSANKIKSAIARWGVMRNHLKLGLWTSFRHMRHYAIRAVLKRIELRKIKYIATSPHSLRVALLHDWLTGYRGGERVFEALCEIFPEAPIYTLLHSYGKSSEAIDSHSLHTSFLNLLPHKEKSYRYFLPLFPTAVEWMKIKEPCDLVISSSHCVIKGLKKPLGSKHLCYIHSPMRYLYDQFDTYFGPNSPYLHRVGMKFFRSYLTNWDIQSNKNVDLMLANSQFIRNRIQKFYHQDAQVVYPFVQLDDFPETLLQEPKKDYDLVLSAFAPNKRIDLAIEAFNRTNEKLVIIGEGQMDRSLRQMAGPNIIFLGHQNRQQVIQHLRYARSLIFPGVEDFGITPLEALACGTPVLAFSHGGVLETLDESVAGFFDEPTPESLIDGLAKLRLKKFNELDLRKRAFDFSKKKFQEGIKSSILKLFPDRALTL